MTLNSLTFFILRQYLKFDKTQPFISITAILAFLGVGIGVMVLLVAMSVMNGMTKEFERKLFIMNYPITIYSTSSRGLSENFLEYLESRFPKLSFSPYIQAQAVIRNGSDIYPMVLYGVDIKRESKVNSILAKSNITAFSSPFEVIIGEQLFNSLISDDIKATFIFTDLAPTGLALTPKMKKFVLKGHFSSGLRNYDNSMAYTTPQAIYAIRGGSNFGYDGFHVFSNDSMNDIILLKKAMEEYERENHVIVHADMEGWWEQNGNFFSAMELEKKALFFMLMLIILMASLNIISSLLMVVMNRRKEIALLISLGASKQAIRRLFFQLGSVIGGSGIIFGVVGAFFVMWLLKTFDIISIPADVYGVSRLPIDLLTSDLIYTIVGACIIVCLSSYYPARRASNIDVLGVLRNE